ncbi:COG4223 family protein [Pseudorhodobacter sp. MZDSW-24AT]|uniref:COG4223 family protein n=1 Tax=Pseudorhodobacter sp. MZDSW-24AT TaxID=2052957 RepID=UPI0012FE0C73|nr:hypothetical protein [Pseudorhodobacter sp. MZDSW-24AT]
MAKRPPSSKSDEGTESASEAIGVPERPERSAEAVISDPIPPVEMPEPRRMEEKPSAVVGDAPIGEPEPPAVTPDLVTPETVTPETDKTAPEPVLPEPPSAAVSEPPRPAMEKRGGGGFLATALGGVVAAAAGYALSIVVPFPGVGTSDAPLTATQAEVQALEARLAALETAPAPSSDLTDRVTALEARPAPAAEEELGSLSQSVTALEQRLAEVEAAAPQGASGAPSGDLVALVDTLRAEVESMRASGADANAGLEALAAQTEARLAEAEAQAAALRAEAEQTARRAVVAAALGRVQAAVDSGQPFAGALTDLAELEVPETLSSVAEAGVPSRAALEDAFPAAARAALDASLRATMGEGWSDRFSTFLQSTTGARSLVPREGDDPDAVLSRAEAALRAGDLELALTELTSLPPEGQAEMAAWTAMAQTRLDALAAVSSLSAAVEG